MSAVDSGLQITNCVSTSEQELTNLLSHRRYNRYSLRQMGCACVKRSRLPCFRVAPQPTGSTGSNEQDNVIYRMPWEAADQKNAAKTSKNHPCCFCWCCLCTFSCKYVSKKTKTSPVSERFTSSVIDVNVDLKGEERTIADKLTKWKTSFDSLITDQTGKRLFQEFLQREYSDENLLFWTDVEEMKAIDDGAKRYIATRRIYKEYIQSRAKKEINVESWVKKGIDDTIERPSADIFDSAQTQVYLLMFRQSWPRFLASKYYLRLVEITKLD